KNKFFILKKTFKDLFNKGFIYISNSLIMILVLFVWKLGGGLRFYYNYRALNAIIKIDRYPLLLIKET
ncbi:hypothetical protein NEUTE1DRAFT_28473, partial [Neurospora tetrasperma FGSC 2508]